MFDGGTVISDAAAEPEVNLSGNVGWTLWNMSKRISASMAAAKSSRVELDGIYESEELAREGAHELEGLVRCLEECAVLAQTTWYKLREAQKEARSNLVMNSGGGCAIDGDEELYGRLIQIYKEGHVSDYEDIFISYKEAVGRVQRR